MKNIFAITLICLLTVGRLYSQTDCCPYISSITIIPSSPTTNDTIKIVTSTATPNLGSKISYSYSQQSDTFDIVGCFWDGMATQPRTFHDTINIGLLAAGTYHVNYVAYSSISSTSCSIIDTSSMTKSFQVSTTSGLENLNSANKLFSVCPNPFNTQATLQIDVPLNNAKIIVVDIFGQTVTQINNVNGQTVTLYRANLPTGLYFVQLTEDSKQIATKKIIITD